jgi:hypothetical protein
MWTTERDQWFLAEMKTPEGSSIGYAILSTKGGNMVTESPDLYDYITEHMKRAGARVLSYEQWIAEEEQILIEQRKKEP